MYEIDKSFTAEYGHRVHSQRLNSALSLNAPCSCRHKHGHSGKIQVYLRAQELNNGMVTDFKNLEWFKQFIDKTIDHKFIWDLSDPYLIHELSPLTNGRPPEFIDIKVPGTEKIAGYILDTEDLVLDYLKQEIVSGLFFVDFLPTSENLAKWAFDVVSSKMNDGNTEVFKVEWWETSKSRSTYVK